MKIILKKAIRVDGTTFPAGTCSTGRTDYDDGETWVEFEGGVYFGLSSIMSQPDMFQVIRDGEKEGQK